MFLFIVGLKNTWVFTIPLSAIFPVNTSITCLQAIFILALWEISSIC